VQNAKILSKIVNARQINVAQHRNMINQIKRSESKSRTARESLERRDLRKQVQLSRSN
jgi:hypothetical protein